MKYFRDLCDSAPVGKRLEHGYTHNVIVSNIDTSIKKDKAMTSKKRIEVTLAQVDPKHSNKVLAESTASFWRLENNEYLASSAKKVISSLLSLGDALGVSEPKFLADVYADIPENEHSPEIWGRKKRTDKEVEAFEEAICSAVDKHFVPLLEDKTLMKCQVFINEKGYFELGTVSGWIRRMDDPEELNKYTKDEIKSINTYLSSLNKKKHPDKVGKGPNLPSMGGVSKTSPPKAELPVGVSGGF